MKNAAVRVFGFFSILCVAGAIAGMRQPDPIPRSADTVWGTLEVGDAVRVELINGINLSDVQRIRLGEPVPPIEELDEDAPVGVLVGMLHSVETIDDAGELNVITYATPDPNAQLGWEVGARWLWQFKASQVRNVDRLIPATWDEDVDGRYRCILLEFNGATP